MAIPLICLSEMRSSVGLILEDSEFPKTSKEKKRKSEAKRKEKKSVTFHSFGVCSWATSLQLREGSKLPVLFETFKLFTNYFHICLNKVENVQQNVGKRQKIRQREQTAPSVFSAVAPGYNTSSAGVYFTILCDL